MVYININIGMFGNTFKLSIRIYFQHVLNSLKCSDCKGIVAKTSVAWESEIYFTILTQTNQLSYHNCILLVCVCQSNKYRELIFFYISINLLSPVMRSSENKTE